MPTPINISASRGAAILGLSSWKTAREVWLEIMESRQPGFCEKNNYLLPVFEDNASMRWGRAFESAIIELAEMKRNCKISDREYFYDYGDYEKPELDNIITCHIDGMYPAEIIDEKSHTFNYPLHEAKTTTEYYFRDNFGEPGSDMVPIEYQIQCQHQMICTSAEKVILSVLVFPKRPEEWEEMGWIADTEDKIVLNPLSKSIYPYKLNNEKDHKIIDPLEWAQTLSDMGYFHQYEINANAELQKMMLEKYERFWNENVLGGVPPEPQNIDDIKRLCRTPSGTIIADENIERLIVEKENIMSEIGSGGALQKRADEIKLIVLEYMNGTGKIQDDDSVDKWILRDRTGKKLMQYGKDKNGKFILR